MLKSNGLVDVDNSDLDSFEIKPLPKTQSHLFCSAIKIVKPSGVIAFDNDQVQLVVQYNWQVQNLYVNTFSGAIPDSSRYDFVFPPNFIVVLPPFIFNILSWNTTATLPLNGASTFYVYPYSRDYSPISVARLSSS